MVAKPIKMKGFPNLGKNVDNLLDSCRNAYAKVTKGIYTDQEGKPFTPEFSPFPENITYTGYQIPRGEILGIRYSLKEGDKNTLTFLNENGNPRPIRFGKKKEKALWEMLKGLNINYDMLLTTGAEASYIVFWFIIGGGYNEKDSSEAPIYGADFIDKFLILIAVNRDGKWLRPTRFRIPTMPIDKRLLLKENNMYYLSEFKCIAGLSPRDPSRFRGVIHNFLEQDVIRDQVLDVKYMTDDTAYGALLVPDYPLFFQRPSLTWSMVKYTNTNESRNQNNA